MAVFSFVQEHFFTLCELSLFFFSFARYRNESSLLQYADLFTFNTTFDVCLVFLFRMHKYIFCN